MLIFIRSEDFDITRGTLLNSELRPDQFNEVTTAIFEKTPHCTCLLNSRKPLSSNCLQNSAISYQSASLVDMAMLYAE